MYDVIILGSGPAGYSAAIYTSRALLKTLLLTGKEEGGQLTTTTEVENYPGFPKGIMGPQLMNDMKAQVLRFETEIMQDEVLAIRKHGNAFVTKGRKKEYEGKAVIIATGASAVKLGIASEEKFRGRGVSYCATCDGFFFRNKEIVVIGGGDTAMEEAIFLSTFASKVTIIHRRDEFRASATMLKRAKENKKITFLMNKTVEEIIGDVTVTGVRLKDAKTGEISAYQTQGVFVAIGHTPNTEFLKGFVNVDAKGYVVTPKKTQTSEAGVFAAGDCVDSHYQQAAVAAGAGVMAALDAQQYLETV